MYCYNCMKKINENSIYCPFCHALTKEDSAPHHLKPGTVLNNRYIVGNSIGEGGFGITYIGRDLKLDMRIAVKEFYPAGFANRANTYSNNVSINYKNGGEYFKSGVERFLQEAKSIAKFNNESSIVDVRDYFEENDTAYIIMEYLEGENLSEKLERDGTFAPDEIFKLFLPIMHTLEKMHRENIIHRDITPQNIRVMPDGTFKLIDFGSARYFDGVDKRTLSVQLKPGYAPIEQYNKNGNQGPWTDVYGLCATIYKCITGKTPVDSLERIQNDTLKKPSSLGVNISASLEKLILYGMELHPENRCRDLKELINLTEQALGGSKENIIVPPIIQSPEVSDKSMTLVADRAYGDTNMYSNADESDFQNFDTYQNRNDDTAQNSNKDMRQHTQKKSNGGLIALIIILSVLLVAGISAFLLLLFGGAKGCNTDIEPVETTSPVTPVTTVSKVDSFFTVPSVIGLDTKSAYNALTDLGLKYAPDFEYDDTVPEGYIKKQTPNAGTKAVKGDTIKLIISKGTEPTTEPPAQSSEEEVYKPEPTAYKKSEAAEYDPRDFTPEVPYLIRVKPVTVIYNEPSYDSGVSMTLDEENVYTIVDERVVDGQLWGKFKSGVGWVCLNEIWENGGSLEE